MFLEHNILVALRATFSAYLHVFIVSFTIHLDKNVNFLQSSHAGWWAGKWELFPDIFPEQDDILEPVRPILPARIMGRIYSVYPPKMGR
jgi:hypothetical protein